MPEATAASDAQSKLTQMRLVCLCTSASKDVDLIIAFGRSYVTTHLPLPQVMLVEANQADAIVKGTQAIVDALTADDDGFVFEEEGALGLNALSAFRVVDSAGVCMGESRETKTGQPTSRCVPPVCARDRRAAAAQEGEGGERQGSECWRSRG